MNMEEPDRWIDLECPVCENDCFDGLGHAQNHGKIRYRHHCPDCGTIISTPVKIDGEEIGTR